MKRRYPHHQPSQFHLLETDCLPSQNLWMKRDDLIHPIASGNKWRKLKFLVEKAHREGKSKLVTFGGAYSNHMVATAATGAACGLQTHCFIRGDEPLQNHYLSTARLFGMQLIPVSRADYKNKELLFHTHFGSDAHALYVAEGGESEEARKGVAEIIQELPTEPAFIIHASATATTACGLGYGIRDLGWKTKVLSVAVLKNAEEQTEKAREAGLSGTVTVIRGDMGGYAKTNPEFLGWVKQFIALTGIFIDPVYTGKALWTLKQQLESGAIPCDKPVVFLHTGGTLGIFSPEFLNA
ncbi:MAG: pyridoxal-phosphate dependent enzyme [Bacteroidetes bacterium]|nr:pyridoxal-phosphate dependent enzyme [Bacteroidota bacterium]